MIRAIAEKKENNKQRHVRSSDDVRRGSHSCQLMVLFLDGLSQVIDVRFGPTTLFIEDLQDTVESFDCSCYAWNLRYLCVRDVSLLLQTCQIDSVMAENVG